MNKQTDMMKITVTSAILQMHLINKCVNLRDSDIYINRNSSHNGHAIPSCQTNPVQVGFYLV